MLGILDARAMAQVAHRPISWLGVCLLAACQVSESGSPAPCTPTPPTVPMPAPMGETAGPLVVPVAPDDEEPLEVLPSVADLAETLELETTPERVHLGRQLFHDPRLSKDLTVSCASCHDLRFGGIDRTERAVGIFCQVGPVNTPTVFNSALGIAQFWDGRAKDLAEQASGPPQAAGEMGSNFPEIVARLRDDAGVVRAFAQAFPGAGEGAELVTTERVLEAIATFEVTLLTPGSRFDRWLEGDRDALTEQERRGYARFKQVGCAQCHYGAAVGGKTFQKLGQKRDFFGARQLNHADLGRYNVTKDERDRHAFKVPSLRNVALTGPYFHDGSIGTLEDAVRAMANYQLGVELAPAEVDDLVAFLRTLTGTYEGRPLAGPTR